jgi:hypothetical protein
MCYSFHAIRQALPAGKKNVRGPERFPKTPRRIKTSNQSRSPPQKAFCITLASATGANLRRAIETVSRVLCSDIKLCRAIRINLVVRRMEEREEGETQKRTLQIFFKKNCSRPRLECSPHHYGFIFYEKKTSDMGEEEEVETKFEVLSPVRLFSPQIGMNCQPTSRALCWHERNSTPRGLLQLVINSDSCA